ncbi:MAG: hypothetical protein NZ866_00535 [Patescibacteria group bacterium]|nr:hypothetical protein [Patescibacteria group bacterium]
MIEQFPLGEKENIRMRIENIVGNLNIIREAIESFCADESLEEEKSEYCK